MLEIFLKADYLLIRISIFFFFLQTAQFASDVGGAIGLWIGLSILAIFEVIQFFLELCAYGVHVWRFKRRKSREMQNRKRNQSRKQEPNEYTSRGDKYFPDYYKRHKHYENSTYNTH